MTEEVKNKLIKCLNSYDEKSNFISNTIHLLVIKEALINGLNIPLDNIYKHIREDYKKNTNKDTLDKAVLYNYLIEKERYNSLNLLIKLLIYDMKFDINYKDLFVLENFELFNNILDVETLKVIDSYIDNYNACEKAFKKISDEEINSIIEEFLIKIDPTLEWLEIYNDIKSKGLIIEVDKLNDILKEKYLAKFSNLENSCIFTNDEMFGTKVYIILNNSNTLRYPFAFFHEFSHYISIIYSKSTYVMPFLKEYSSIFYERYFVQYLNSKGYDSDELNYLIRYRDKNTLDNSLDIKTTLKYIKYVLEGKEINEEEEITKCMEAFNNLPTYVIEMIKKVNPKMFNFKDYAHKECDEVCDALIEDPLIFSKTYSYIIGSFLANNSLDKVNSDESFLKRMKYITENLSIIDPNLIFSELGIDTTKITSKENIENYRKVKKS